MKVVIGARDTFFDGWISTQQNELDLMNHESFEKFFGEKRADAMLCEHVLEHITLEDARNAAKMCFEFLKPGGYIRVAVPDCNFRNEWYQNYCKIGGDGNPASSSYDHKFFYDYKTLRDVFSQAGFNVELLEYCDNSGTFHYNYWNDDDGHISRSYRYDKRNTEEKLGMISIIIDAKKPLVLDNYN